MSKLALGSLSGAGLGLLDGVSAVFNPEAHSMLAIIIASATIKGAVTGVVVAYLARRIDGVVRNIGAGAIVGLVLSLIVAIPSGTYVEIILPGVIIGALVGTIVAKFGR